MTEVNVSQPIQEPKSEGLIDDEAFLMTMVEADALLPSNLAFSSLFGADNGLNPDDLSDIASLLAPQVSDDDHSESAETLRPSTPVVAPSTDSATKVPILPNVETPAVVSPTGGSSKRSFVLLQAPQASSAPPPKKAKASASASAVVSAPNTPFPSLAQPNALPLDESKQPTLPALAPKPPAITSASSATAATKPLPTAVIKKKADPASKAGEKPPLAPSNKTKATTKAPAKAVATVSDPNALKPLNDEERAQQCRDRNRQHARNTRLRKKAYVEDLKRQLRVMAEQRDARLLEEAQKAKIVEQQREVRFQVMQDFLQLRGRNEGNPQRWCAILEEGFSLTLPKTKFQSMVVPKAAAPQAGPIQVLHGVSDIMADSTYFATFLQSLPSSTCSHSHTTHPTGNDTNIPIKLAYHCDRGTFLMDGVNALMNWTASSVGAVASGASRELELCGSMRARFCAQTNRLVKAEVQFDTGFVHSQLFF